ncbi:MAG: ATP phosphoribosyltransferase regulatory subunit [Cyanobacteriota bacterium]
MALQPAAGTRDLNPGEVDSNRRLSERLARVYRLWGYEEVAPPTVERLDTLAAGGGIDAAELVQLASHEPLALRPEMTASIARAACTRMAHRPRPLRLWSSGLVFTCRRSDNGGQRIQERLQSGVELLGLAGAAADAELMRLLLAASADLGLEPSVHQPTLLVGHHGLLAALLEGMPQPLQRLCRQALTDLDPLALSALPLTPERSALLQRWIRLRGEPDAVLGELRAHLGDHHLLSELSTTLAGVADAARSRGVRLQLDPTFQPHFALYDGLVLKLVCQGLHAPVEIASGGRYDALVGRFSLNSPGADTTAAGVGFSVDLDALRELLAGNRSEQRRPTLVAFGTTTDVHRALDQLEALHRAGRPAELLSEPMADRADADRLARERGHDGVVWVG